MSDRKFETCDWSSYEWGQMGGHMVLTDLPQGSHKHWYITSGDPRWGRPEPKSWSKNRNFQKFECSCSSMSFPYLWKACSPQLMAWIPRPRLRGNFWRFRAPVYHICPPLNHSCCTTWARGLTTYWYSRGQGVIPLGSPWGRLTIIQHLRNDFLVMGARSAHRAYMGHLGGGTVSQSIMVGFPEFLLSLRPNTHRSRLRISFWQFRPYITFFHNLFWSCGQLEASETKNNIAESATGVP